MSGDITIKKSVFNKILVGFIVVSVVSAFLGGYILGTNEQNSNIQSSIIQTTQTTTSTQPERTPIIQVSLDDDPLRGDENAPINLIEFSDFGCPFCAKFHQSTLPLIEENYIKTGKVKFIYRDFPILNLHPNAGIAAMSAECANDQGMFWQYHDYLFENQNSWQKLQSDDAADTFKQYAAELNLNTENFNSCLGSGKYANEVNNDLNDGRFYDVTGTPTFFVGNDKIGYTKVSGAQPYPVFERLFEEQLKILQ